MMNFYRDNWFEPNDMMGEILEMYYNLLSVHLLYILCFLGFFFFFFNYSCWTTEGVAEHEMEFIFFLIPIVFLSLFIGVSLNTLYSEEKLYIATLAMKLTGNQWYWTVEYGYNFSFNIYILKETSDYFFRNIDTTCHMFIPVNVPTVMLVTSSDVIHSVGFPDMGLKVDAIPGRLNSLEIYSLTVGTMNGFCTELCGPLHAYMPFQIEFIF